MHIRLGSAQARAGDTAAAVDSLRRAVELQPADPDARHLLGLALLAVGLRDDGLRELEQALTLDPTHRAAATLARIRPSPP